MSVDTEDVEPIETEFDRIVICPICEKPIASPGHGGSFTTHVRKEHE